MAAMVPKMSSRQPSSASSAFALPVSQPFPVNTNSGAATPTRHLFPDSGFPPYYSLPTSNTSYERDHSNYEQNLYSQQTAEFGLRNTSARRSRLVSVNYAEDNSEDETEVEDMASSVRSKRAASTISDTGDVDFEPDVDEVEPIEEDEAGAIEVEQQSGSAKKKKAPKTGGTTKRGTERVRQAVREDIPKTMEEMSKADRLLWDMRKDDIAFNIIQPKYEAIIGKKLAASTLPNRYTRLRENLAAFNAEDDEMLKRCARIIFETFEKEKWEMVKEMMVASGGPKFAAKAIGSRYDELKEKEAQYEMDVDAEKEDLDLENED